MKKQEFVQLLLKIEDASLKGLENIIRDPPGRRPYPGLVHLSEVLEKLNPEQASAVKFGLRLASRHMLNNLLLVLDNDLKIVDDHGFSLKLIASENDIEHVLNSPNGASLSDYLQMEDAPQ